MVQQLMLGHPPSQLRARLNLQSGEDALEMRFDRSLGHHQPFADLTIAQSRGDQVGDLELARRQRTPLYERHGLQMLCVGTREQPQRAFRRCSQLRRLVRERRGPRRQSRGSSAQRLHLRDQPRIDLSGRLAGGLPIELHDSRDRTGVSRCRP